MNLTTELGQTASNEVCSLDLASMQNLLVAGYCGQGKTNCLRKIITSLISQNQPSELKLVLLDPKAIELEQFSDINKDYCFKVIGQERAVATGIENIVEALKAITVEIENRKQAQADTPDIVVVIDEYGDLLLLPDAEQIEDQIAYIAKNGHDVGVHLIISTQRIREEVLTKKILKHVQGRIAFRVSARKESRMILKTVGAERIGLKGECLYLNEDNIVKLQCYLLE